MNNTEDEGFLDNFNESHQTGSIVGSHISGSNRHFLQPPQPVANKDFQKTSTSHADFERDHEDFDDASSYEEYDVEVEEEGGKKSGSDSDDDVGSFYNPTIINKKTTTPTATKTKKKKKKKKKTKYGNENLTPQLQLNSEFINSPD